MLTTVIVLAIVLIGGGYFLSCLSAYRDSEAILNRLDKFS